MRKDGVVELVRRAVTLALLVIGVTTTLVDLRSPSWLGGSLWAIAAIAVYVLIPRPSIPPKALRHEPMPSTTMPDVLGFFLGVCFFALPIVMMDNDPSLSGLWMIPAVSWFLGLFALAILYIAASYSCSWVALREDGMTIANLWRIVDLHFADIARVRAVEHRLPSWVKFALLSFGGIRGAGVALLHAGRASHTLAFDLKSGRSVKIPADAFPGLPRVIASLRRAGIALDDALA